MAKYAYERSKAMLVNIKWQQNSCTAAGLYRIHWTVASYTQSMDSIPTFCTLTKYAMFSPADVSKLVSKSLVHMT